jgi:hypothetical protein
MGSRHFGNQQYQAGNLRFGERETTLKEDSLPTVGFSGRVLAEPAGKPNGSAHVGPPELNRRQYFRSSEIDA